MISEKMAKMASGGSVIRAIFEEGKRLSAIYGKENVFDFSIGNPSFPPPGSVKDAIIDIITNEDPMYVHGYPANSGYPEVRRAIADSLNRRFGTAYTEGNIMMTVGAAGGLSCTMVTLLNPGDEVICITPYFFEYNNYVTTPGGKVVTVPASAENGFMPDVDAIAAAVTPKTKAVILNSPNNPTGVIYPADLLRKYSDMLLEKGREYGTVIYTISDEPYRELAYDGAEVPWMPGCVANCIVCYSWSKSLSLPGERIGYVVVPSDIADGQLIFDAEVVANRMLGFVNAPSLMELVVARCVDEPTNIAGYDANRKLLYDGLTALGFEGAYPAGAFYLWIKTTIEESAFVEKAKSYNLLLVPGSNFGTPGYVRLAYCVSPDMIERSMTAFARLAADCGLGK
ncbi:MAG TPA: pyridoxal phosphate-dependent aminotransferase [Candidatus Scatomorpha intestinavium]|uniref:Pyridoxal phosphate-dependent aminotransferase n=1 Tax=Candidatus Scatomorpha intestinavium TaxID=2840922 RepID=A0A9D0ZCE8_9FIRM|nr:pyridoxal phosphate-dependent aminotransferase [Candidatus Scatomorpha intestinavium]